VSSPLKSNSFGHEFALGQDEYEHVIPRRSRATGLDPRGVVPMSDCLHCDTHEILESHQQSEQADLAEIAARVTGCSPT
jgi:hypothetical protein